MHLPLQCVYLALRVSYRYPAYMAENPRSALVLTAQAMAVDQMTCEVIAALEKEGINAILLKGPSIAQWLYPAGGRPYGDSDLLVSPADFTRAASLLRKLGFGAPAWAWAEHAHTYRRVDESGCVLCVDLHRVLPYLTSSPASSWQILSTGTDTMYLHGVPVQVLGVPQRVLHIAIHALQHAFESKSPFEDLRRAIGAVDVDVWHDVVSLSRALGAEDALAAGLCLIPEGKVLADQLALTSKRRGTLRMAASATSDGPAYQVQRILDASSLGERMKLVFNPAFVSPTFMRQTSPLARRGRTGLTLAYAARPFLLVGRLGPALVNRRRILDTHD
jgi:hypothetical protein